MRKEIRNEINAAIALVIISALLLVSVPTVEVKAGKPIEISIK